MTTNKLILRTLNSGFPTPFQDTTLGSVLSHAELDSNFIYLKSEIIYTASTSDKVVTLNKIGGKTIDLDLTPLFSGTAENDFTTASTLNNNSIIFDRTDRLSAYTVDLEPLLTGFSTTELWVTGTGVNSAILVGSNGFADGEGSISIGINVENYGFYSFLGGGDSTNHGDLSLIMASSSLNHGHGSAMFGDDLLNMGEFNLVGGVEHRIDVPFGNIPSHSVVWGTDNIMNSKGVVFGIYNLNSMQGNTSHIEGSGNGSFAQISHIEGQSNITTTIDTYTDILSMLNDTITVVDSLQFQVNTYVMFNYIGDLGYGDTYTTRRVKILSKTGNTLTVDRNLNGDTLLSSSQLNPTGSTLFAPYRGYSDRYYGVSHVEGRGNIAVGYVSHVEGFKTLGLGDYSHVEGFGAVASGIFSHAEGSDTVASGEGSHAEGGRTTASGDYSHAEGSRTTASGDYSHAEGFGAVASGVFSHAEGSDNVAYGEGSHAEGSRTTASGTTSHSEGSRTTASGDYSHAEGFGAVASGVFSHAEGSDTVASGEGSHAEGSRTTASGDYSHAEGSRTTANGEGSHAGGSDSTVFSLHGFVHGQMNVLTSDAINSAIVGGFEITGDTANTTYVPNLNIDTIPQNDNVLTQVLVRDSISGDVKYKDISSFTDLNVTGGTYDINTGIVTFTNNEGNTFDVGGFTSGMTDSFTTGATLNGSVIEFGNNLMGDDYYNIDLTSIVSGNTFLNGLTTITGTTRLGGNLIENTILTLDGTSEARQYIINDHSDRVYQQFYTSPSNNTGAYTLRVGPDGGGGARKIENQYIVIDSNMQFFETIQGGSESVSYSRSMYTSNLGVSVFNSSGNFGSNDDELSMVLGLTQLPNNTGSRKLYFNNITTGNTDTVYNQIYFEDSESDDNLKGVYLESDYSTGWDEDTPGNILGTKGYIDRTITDITDIFTTGATNIGGGTEIYKNTLNNELQFRTLTGSSTNKVSVNVSGDTIEFDIIESNLDIYNLVVGSNRLISGGATYLSGLTFNISSLSYIMNGLILNNNPSSVTLNSGDTTFNRIDVLVVDFSGGTSVVEGTPSVNPVKPEIDTNLYLEITFVTVDANSTSPNVGISTIYDENLGVSGGEWNVINTSPTVNKNSTNDSFSGVKSIELTNFGFASFSLDHVTDYDTSNDTSFTLYIKNKSQWNNSSYYKDSIIIYFLDSSNNTLGSFILSHGQYGFDGYNTSDWQTISVSMGEINLSNGNVRSIQVSSYGWSTNIDCYIDLIRFQDGTPTDGGTSLTFDNGLTQTGTNVQLGGPLIKDTEITVEDGNELKFNLDYSDVVQGSSIKIVDNEYLDSTDISGAYVSLDSLQGGGSPTFQKLMFSDSQTNYFPRDATFRAGGTSISPTPMLIGGILNNREYNGWDGNQWRRAFEEKVYVSEDWSDSTNKYGTRWDLSSIDKTNAGTKPRLRMDEDGKFTFVDWGDDGVTSNRGTFYQSDYSTSWNTNTPDSILGTKGYIDRAISSVSGGTSGNTTTANYKYTINGNNNSSNIFNDGNIKLDFSAGGGTSGTMEMTILALPPGTGTEVEFISTLFDTNGVYFTSGLITQENFATDMHDSNGLSTNQRLEYILSSGTFGASYPTYKITVQRTGSGGAPIVIIIDVIDN